MTKEELIIKIEEALEEAKSDKKKCWREDVEEKALADGEIGAYHYALAMIKLLD